MKRNTLLIDLDLQFGDVGIMMGIDPAQTIVDLVTTNGRAPPDKLSGYVVNHQSGMDVLCAPLRPEDAKLVTEDRIGQLIDVAKSAYDMVVLDTPPHFDATRWPRSTAATVSCWSRRSTSRRSRTASSRCRP